MHVTPLFHYRHCPFHRNLFPRYAPVSPSRYRRPFSASAFKSHLKNLRQSTFASVKSRCSLENSKRISLEHICLRKEKGRKICNLLSRPNYIPILVSISIHRSPTNTSIDTKIVRLQDLTGARRGHDLHMSELTPGYSSGRGAPH